VIRGLENEPIRSWDSKEMDRDCLFIYLFIYYYYYYYY